jgi:hypothetical protein
MAMRLASSVLPNWVSGRRMLWLWSSIAVSAVVLGVVAWLVWPSPEVPRALRYQDFDTCVLVGDRGITGDPAAGLWASLRDGTAAAKVRLSYLKVSGPQTEEQARLFVPTLVRQGCDIIVGVGANPAAAAKALAASYPDVRFLAVESDDDVNGVAAQVMAMLPTT